MWKIVRFIVKITLMVTHKMAILIFDRKNPKKIYELKFRTNVNAKLSQPLSSCQPRHQQSLTFCFSFFCSSFCCKSFQYDLNEKIFDQKWGPVSSNYENVNEISIIYFHFCEYINRSRLRFLLALNGASCFTCVYSATKEKKVEN